MVVSLHIFLIYFSQSDRQTERQTVDEWMGVGGWVDERRCIILVGWWMDGVRVGWCMGAWVDGWVDDRIDNKKVLGAKRIGGMVGGTSRIRRLACQ